ncbi:transglycosylase SLT domain-containing protein [Desulfovibrio ferrophilus]|uniref:Transglycosylase SLT domain-containing protein n=1 Tax=Desulfovibrio ferrophilus TaxID=241368 RepID=A0A2Z6AZZ9_9BACT|nr:transglycosylase SLT domain-containing protein [Desulfovibrio ferrophilus]BBD08773.1 uncharacterized protein DFE_2047 [Desulfovibrio ferrophilus]
MRLSRRNAIKVVTAATLAPMFGLSGATSAEAATNGAFATGSPINVIIPKNYVQPLDGKQGRIVQARLGRAVLETVRTHYKGKNLPVWKQKYGTMDLEKRVMNICHWIIQSVREHRDVYPLDPAWVAAQIMTESFFYEFAVSRALAVGICQFITPTAREYKLVCAGTRSEHSAPPYRKTDWSGEQDIYYEQRTAWKQARRTRLKISGDESDFLLKALRAGIDGKSVDGAQKYLEACDKIEALDKQVKQARERFTSYLQQNFKGRSIFASKDVAFFKEFDERVLYKKPVSAMVLMLARFLRARNGNIIAAAAGYHSGLSNTREDHGVYGRYGRIPGFDSTVSYISRILVNHHEIASRMVTT